MHDGHGIGRERQQCVEARLERHEREVEADERVAGAEPATDAEPHRQPRRARRGERERRVVRLLQHLDDQEIDAGGRQRVRELAVGGVLDGFVGVRVQIEARRQARDGPCDGDRAPRCIPRLTRRGDRAPVDCVEVGAVARGFEHETRGSERARRDDVGAGRDVIGVYVSQQIVVRERDRARPGRVVERRAAAAQLGAGAAVE